MTNVQTWIWGEPPVKLLDTGIVHRVFDNARFRTRCGIDFHDGPELGAHRRDAALVLNCIYCVGTSR